VKAIVMHKRGAVDVLQYEDAPEPTAGPGEVLVRVYACGLNHLDVYTRQGAQAVKAPLPHILGLEPSGEVVELGQGVESVRLGDRVVIHPNIVCGDCPMCRQGHDNLCFNRKFIGVHVDGGYAQYVKVPARNLFAVPDRVSFEEAAACPVAFGTAWHMLVTRAAVRPGETVLILAAGSGVGTAGIQVARYLGARVIAAASTDQKLTQAKALGADAVVNYSQGRWSSEVRRLTDGWGVDVVFEHVGPSTWEQSVASLAPNGRLVTCGATTGRWGNTDLWSLFGKQISLLGSFGANLADTREVVQRLYGGVFKPVIDRVLPLREARLAHELLEGRQVFGKLILTPP
jgi:NADPH:quinone reductase-like Zn-dependent oxidoreductase